MSIIARETLSRYLEDTLIRLVSYENVKFVRHVSPNLITDTNRFFKTFIPNANSYIIIIPADLKNDKLKEDLISMSRNNFNFTVLTSVKLKDKILIIGYE
ncbi:DUF4898 domain-containing protein [Sulfolobus tengchongensis]|uniref:DUF4898 domain-containing protein n=1 Tax=Sulfolobus tengchongensis TaxID=207809 RepID=A0AAX4L3T2_9CREN